MANFDKVYIFFVSTIGNIGGSQLYLKAKIEFLEKNGWNVIVFYYQKGNILINNFNNYKTIHISKLGLPSYYYIQFMRNSIIKKILKHIPKSEICYIESHSLSLSTWAEMVATKIKAKHLIYNIDETVYCRPNLFNFYKFKYLRKEFAAIFDNSLPLFFKGYNFELVHGTCFLQAHGTGECITDYEYPLTKLLDNSYTIGVVGRLDKKYVTDSTDQLSIYLKENLNKKFNIVYVGGEQNGNSILKYLKQKLSDLNNANIYFTGFIYPMPLKLIEKFDICIAGSGTATAISSYGIPTIIFDPRDTLPFGVLNITTTNTVFKNDEDHIIPLGTIIDDIIKNKEKYKINKIDIPKIGFNDHLNFMINTNNHFEYYTDYNKICSINIIAKNIILLFFDYHLISSIYRQLKGIFQMISKSSK